MSWGDNAGGQKFNMRIQSGSGPMTNARVAGDPTVLGGLGLKILPRVD